MPKSSAKWKCHYDSQRKYRTKWQKKHSWLQKNLNSEDSFCKLCYCKVKSKLYNFAQHELCAKHKSKVIAVNQNTITSFVTKRNSDLKKNIKHDEIKFYVGSCYLSLFRNGS